MKKQPVAAARPKSSFHFEPAPSLALLPIQYHVFAQLPHGADVLIGSTRTLSDAEELSRLVKINDGTRAKIVDIAAEIRKARLAEQQLIPKPKSGRSRR